MVRFGKESMNNGKTEFEELKSFISNRVKMNH
jgi:hypothetical protein